MDENANVSLRVHDLYRTLLNENDTYYPLPRDITSCDNAFLLLMAILSDLLCMRQSLGRIISLAESTNKPTHRHNPFVPLSPHTELDRIQNLLSSALDRWYNTFHTSTSLEVMAFYHYCKLCLDCDHLLELPHMVAYKPLSPASSSENGMIISAKSMRHAWLVPDNAAARSKVSSLDSLSPVWLPIIVFHASLVVWATHSLSNLHESDGYSNAKVLLAFKIELNTIPWRAARRWRQP